MANGVDLRNFIKNMSWDEYLEEISNREWGDHICLLVISHIYRITVVIVSSHNSDINFLNVHETHGEEHRTINLGHEFETHYIRLHSLEERHNDNREENPTLNSGSTQCSSENLQHSLNDIGTKRTVNTNISTDSNNCENRNVMQNEDCYHNENDTHAYNDSAGDTERDDITRNSKYENFVRSSDNLVDFEYDDKRSTKPS